jgi:hypothetical protein
MPDCKSSILLPWPDMKLYILTLILFLPLLSMGQNAANNSNIIFWSKERRLQEADFQIKIRGDLSSYSAGQYYMGYESLVGIFTIGLPKNYKKRIRSYFVKSASWIDTTYDVATSIRYQQTLFDLSEVCVRQLRKSIYENWHKKVKARKGIEELHAQVLTDFANRRTQYDLSTDFGTLAAQQKLWEMMIAKELDDLKEYSAD